MNINDSKIHEFTNCVKSVLEGTPFEYEIAVKLESRVFEIKIKKTTENDKQ